MSEVEVTQVDQEEYPEMHRVLELALEAGRILLRNGAEIFRVEETIEHICKRFGVEAVDSFVLDVYKRQALMMALVFSVTTVFAGCGAKDDQKQSDGGSDKTQKTFTVGFDQDFPPMGFVGDDGEYTGFDLDLAKEVADRLDIDVYKRQTLDSKVKIVYQINRGEMEKLDYQSESLLPMYGTCLLYTSESCEQSGQTLMVRDTGLMQVQGKCLKDALHLEAHGIIYRKKTDI